MESVLTVLSGVTRMPPANSSARSAKVVRPPPPREPAPALTAEKASLARKDRALTATSAPLQIEWVLVSASYALPVLLLLRAASRSASNASLVSTKRAKESPPAISATSEKAAAKALVAAAHAMLDCSITRKVDAASHAIPAPTPKQEPARALLAMPDTGAKQMHKAAKNVTRDTILYEGKVSVPCVMPGRLPPAQPPLHAKIAQAARTPLRALRSVSRAHVANIRV